MLDENDNDPKFSDDIIDASMKENEARGTLVDTITTTDADSAANTRLTYSINNTDFSQSMKTLVISLPTDDRPWRSGYILSSDCG